MDFGQPNAEIGRKMANGWLLFLALYLWILLPIIDKWGDYLQAATLKLE